MMRATRPPWAPKRSVSKATLLALGRADSSTSTTSACSDSGTPRAMAARPPSHMSSGCSSSLARASGT
ncbi:hypothetical protein D3C80_2169030 [compost metagenome]